MWGCQTRKFTRIMGQHRLGLLLSAILLLMLLMSSLPAGTQAQGDPLPTPTNIGEGEDRDDDDDDGGEAAPPASPRAGLSGYVYGYSDGAYVGDVIVVFESPGWQTETVTDSNGFYQFRGLDSGIGVLNLRLPPGATSVTKDWPVRLVRGQETQVNLGYYWGNNPPIPVRLSADATNGQLMVQIENRTDEDVTGGLVQIEPVEGATVSLPVEASHGQVVDYSAYDFQVELSELEAGETANITVQLDPSVENFQAGQEVGQVRVLFTYDQQITPQVVEIDLSAADFQAPQAEAGAPGAQEAAQEFAPPPAPGNQAGQAPAATPTSLAVAQAAPQATPAAPATPSGQTGAQPTVQAQAGQPLPTTGVEKQPVNNLAILIGLSVLGLVLMGGWQALKVNDEDEE